MQRYQFVRIMILCFLFMGLASTSSLMGQEVTDEAPSGEVTEEITETVEPTALPTETPTAEFTEEPTVEVTLVATEEATEDATSIPTAIPTETPDGLFQDDFQDGDTAGWQIAGWSLAQEGGNQFLSSDEAGAVAEVVGVDWPHFLLSVQVRGALSVHFRAGLSLQVEDNGDTRLLQNGVVLAEGLAADDAGSPWRTLNLQAWGNSVTVAIDQAVQFSYADSAIDGQGGLSFRASAEGAGLDDVTINRLDAPIATSTPPATATETATEEVNPQKRAIAQSGRSAPTPTDLWAVILTPGTDPAAVAQQQGFVYVGPVGVLENTYLFRLAGSETGERARAARQALRTEPRIEWFEQQFAVQHFTRQGVIDNTPRPVPADMEGRVPGDPLFNNQWHLRNTGQFGGLAGNDVKVVPVWDNMGYTGSGAVIAIVDDGLQHDHPDLAANYVPGGSYDFNFNDADPYPDLSFDPHGTSAGGVAAARDNGSCGVGAAFRAGLSGIRLIAGGVTDATEASALNYQFNINDIYNNSWGPADIGVIAGPGNLTRNALANGTLNGRGGLGSIFVWAGGNGLQNSDNVNADGYANSPYTIAVGAIDHRGRQSSYSEPGSALHVVAPSSGDTVGITTTDLTGGNGYNGYPGSLDCTNNFGGTSSASPLVAGVVALMLEANPGLGWRDVQHILARTADKNDPTDRDWRRNRAGFNINHKYGFGRVNAERAVYLAEEWQNVPTRVTYSTSPIMVNTAIPDNKRSGIINNINLTVPDPNFVIEHVEIVFNATHTYRGDLQIELTGPRGTKSLLINQRLNDAGNNYANWRFMTVRQWGETGSGRWSLKVADLVGDDVGTFNSWQIVLHGYSRPAKPIGRPTLIEPARNSFINDNTPFFNWTGIPNATSYYLEMATDSRFRNIYARGTLSGLDAVLLSPAPNGKYFWRVTGRNINEYGKPSASGIFTIDTVPPGPPTPLSPANGAIFTTTTPSLKWQRGTESYRSHLQIATSAAFGGTIVYDASPLTGGSRRIPAGILTPGTTYYWRVRSLDRAGNPSAFSSVFSFNIP